MNRSEATNIVLYDDRCAFCVSQTRLLRRLDWFGVFSFQGISRPESANLISSSGAGLPEAIHCVARNGETFRAARCVRYIALRIPLLIPIALLLWIPGMLWVGEKIYIRIARHRYFLSRFFACDSVCDGSPHSKSKQEI